MEVLWLTPAAWWGSATLAVPVVIHLLTRDKTRRLPFPTLRFLRSTRLTALRRRSIHDWPLLIVRALILLAAVAALAGPVFVSADRQDAWQRRMARAVVVGPQTNGIPELDAMIGDETRGSFVSAVFRAPEHLADGLRDAAAWLDRQPRAAREILIAGDLKEGAISAPDLEMIPSAVGIRFLPASPVRSISTPTLPVGIATVANVTLLGTSTRVSYSVGALREAPATRDLPISVRAAPDDRDFANAARNAVVARGVRVDRSGSRRVLVVFDGGDVRDLRLQQPASAGWMRETLSRLAGMTGGQYGDSLVVMTNRRANDVSAVHVIDRVARAAFAEDFSSLEPRRISAATLASWSRPPGPVDAVPTTDEGDRRWLWGAALALILIETILRRRSTPVASAQATEEKQVA